jgi:diguanylate cyclase (GGDEF)-like protein/PAS domain S-box-containing protein
MLKFSGDCAENIRMVRTAVFSRRAWLVGLALLAAFASVGLMLGRSQASARAQRQRSAESAGYRALGQSVAAVLADERALAAIVGVLHTSVAGRWGVFSRVLMSDPATSGANLILPVPERRRTAFQRAHRLKIVRVSPTGVVRPAPRRPVYWVLTAHVGRRGSIPAQLGVDVGESPLRRRYLLASAATGLPEATPPTQLLTRGAGHTTGVVVFEVIRSPAGRLLGWVSAAYSAVPLEAAVAARVPGVRLSVRDGSAVLLPARGAAARSGRREVLEVAGQRWQVRVWAPPGPVSLTPWLVLAFGALISAMAVLLVRALELKLGDRALGLREAQTLARIGSWSWNPRDDSGVWSEEMYRIFGRDPAAGPAPRAEFINYVRPADRPAVAALYTEMLEGRSGSALEFWILGGDGAERALHVVARPHPRRRGRFVGTVQDVTELRATERELIFSQAKLAAGQARLQAVIDHAPADHHTPAALAKIRLQDERLIHERTPTVDEMEVPHVDGTLHTYHVVKYPIIDDRGRLTGLGSFSLDITQRKQVELELKRAIEHSDAIIAAMAEGYGLTVGGEITAVNDALCEMTGFSRDELVGMTPPYAFWPLEQLTETAQLRDRVIAGSGASFGLTLVRKDGTRFEAELTARAAHNPDGTVLGFVTTFRDVSERNRHQAELDRERRDLNAAQAVARVGSWDQNLTGDDPGRWSQELWRMLALEPQPHAPTSPQFLAMIHPEDRDRVTQAIAHAHEADEPWDGEFRMLKGDGQGLVVAYRIEFVHDGTGRQVSAYGTIQEITDRAQRDREEAAVRDIAQLVAQGAGPAAVFDQVARQLLELFDGHSGIVVRFDETKRRAVFVNGITADGRSLIGSELSLDGQSAPAMVFAGGRASRSNGARTTGFSPELVEVVGEITDAVAAPIVVAGQLWGCLAAAFSRGPAPADTERRLERFAALVAMAIANAEAWDILQSQASTDGVTGLANHRSFQARLAAEVARARRYRRDLSLVLFDLDHFKRINDVYGHQAGDRVLAEVGRQLTEQARDGDLVARIGGEEFAWLMPETDRDRAVQAAERMRRTIERHRFDGVGMITVSAGICVREDGLEGDDLVRLADRALYWAKDGGRNTIFVYTDDADALLSHHRTVEPGEAAPSVRALARAIDSKDHETREHSQRVADLAEQLALALGWTEKRARMLHAAGLLHDVGKIGIPDRILLKPGPLSPSEYEQVKQHAELSARIAGEVLETEPVSWIRAHHERWDGSGYPCQLVGDQIPDGAQILAVADAYDVMTANRSYKSAITAAEALSECRASAGRHFAPTVVEALGGLLRESAGGPVAAGDI